MIDDPNRPGTRDLLGGWLFPVTAILTLLSLVIGQWLGRFFIRLMMRRPRKLG